MKDFMKYCTFISEEVMKREANIPSKAINEVKTRQSGLPVASSDPSCYLLQTGAFPQGSRRVFEVLSKAAICPNKAVQTLAWQTLHSYTSKICEAKAPGWFFSAPPPVSVQSPCNNTVKTQSQHPVAVTGILELASLTKVIHQTGWVVLRITC